jgi:SAM-dependent methyltransferase
MNLDWGAGSYETTAAQLWPAAERVVEHAGIRAGERVVDVGCGTGNGVLVAARRGASVVGIDPSASLVERAAARVHAEGVKADIRHGEAASIPCEDGAFDAAIAIFSVIFALDPAAAVAGMVRAVRPGGRIAVASWVPRGAIHESSNVFLRVLAPGRPPSPWGAPETLTALFAPHGATVEIHEERLSFEAPSPQAWFEDVENNHPAWRLFKESAGERWDALKRDALGGLVRSNELAQGFRVTSEYLIAVVSLPG